MTDWCILRMAPSRTLAVARSLADAGFEVWTPTETVTRRVGHSRDRREEVRPIAPGFVFAPYVRVNELAELARSNLPYRVWDPEQRRMVVKGYPHFSVFRHLDTYPWVADRELDALRLAEQRGKSKVKVPPLARGARVKHPESGFEGMVGTVQGTKGRYALVIFDGFALPVQIEPRQLIAC